MSKRSLPVLIICADATPTMGTGHVMRCLALAQTAKRHGITAHLIGRINVPWVLERLRQEDIPFTELAGPVSARENAAELLSRCNMAVEPSWVVLDGYHFGLDCHKAVRNAGHKLLVIDDYAHLPEYCCDLLLNQNIGAGELPYKGDIGKKLLGPKFALLRQEFIMARQLAEKRISPSTCRNILLTLGGGDFSKHLEQLAPYFETPLLSGCTVRVIAGSMPPEHIQSCLQNCPATIEILQRVENMPAILLQTDLCITAGGSTCWELCCLGVPFLTVEVAENQRDMCKQLELQGIAPRFSGVSLITALDKSIREYASRTVDSLVDGAGCHKLVALICHMQDITIVPAKSEDCLLLHALTNEPSIRAASCSTAPISLAEHTEWYKKRLGKKNSPFYLVWQKEQFVGYVRYDATGTPGESIVSIALTKESRGKSLGGLLLQKTAKLAFATGICRVIAWVKPDNQPSKNAFLQAGYSPLGTHNYNGTPMLCFILVHSRCDS